MAGFFSRAKIVKGLENVKTAYGELGYLNFTLVPETRFIEDDRTVKLDIDFDESKQFFVGGGEIRGLEEHERQETLRSVLLKRGDPYNERLFEQSLTSMWTLETDVPFSTYSLKRDDRAGTVVMTFYFRHCPTEQSQIQ
jgi:outer membrane protein insertion porin family